MAASKSPMHYFFDSKEYEPFELGAKLITLLAFPSCQEIDLRKQAFEALCAQVIQATCAAEPGDAAWWRDKFPSYASIDEREIRRRLRTLRRRLGDRMTAAQIALGYFDEALRHMWAEIGEAYPELKPEIGEIERRPTPLPDGVPRHSINALIRYHYPNSNEDGWHNKEHRVSRASQPVIHLATALHAFGRQLQPAAGDFGYRLDDMGLHQRVLELAEVNETAVDFEWGRRHAPGATGSSRFMINPRVLIRVRAEKTAA